MTAKILQIEYKGEAVPFNADGWINATAAAPGSAGSLTSGCACRTPSATLMV